MPFSPLDMLRGLVRPVASHTKPTLDDAWSRADTIGPDLPASERRSVPRGANDEFLSSRWTPTPQDQLDAMRNDGSGLMMAGALGPKALPEIAPAAYQDVKAGGLRLYSRLTDAFSRAPGMMHPSKVLDVAKQGASTEEIGLRKLAEFMQGRDPNAKINRNDVLSHLAANPLELNVVRKGAGEEGVSDLLKFEHELDTRYGGQWSLENITQEERNHYNNLEQLHQEHQRDYAPTTTNYDWLQTKGPKENYGESLINYHPSKRTGPFDQPPNSPLTPEFQASHFPDDPNNLVFSRHNDRMSADPAIPQTWTESRDPDLPSEWGLKGKKGRLVEEIQSDLHQQGREKGYKGHPETVFDLGKAKKMGVNMSSYGGAPVGSTEWMFPYLQKSGKNIGGVAGFGNTFDEALADVTKHNDQFGDSVPDLPYKDTSHSLALKQQLLDSANDPSHEWFGVADANTNATMEGHKGVMPGTSINYDEKYPAELGRLMKPYGAEVAHRRLPQDIDPPFQMLSGISYSTTGGERIHPKTGVVHKGINRIIDTKMFPGQGTHVADTIPNKTVGEAYSPYMLAKEIQRQNYPSSSPKTSKAGVWGFDWTPEMKSTVAKRGFPAMAALLALQQSMKQRSNDVK